MMGLFGANAGTKTAKVEQVKNSLICETVDDKHGLSVLQQQQNNKWCDVELFGKDSTIGIKGHKMILAAASPYLHDALNSKGFVDSNAKKYHVKQIDHASLQVIVDFIYSSTLRLAGDSMGDRLKSVLIGADYLLMPNLVRVCGENLARAAFLHAASGVEMWLFARKYHCSVLEAAAVRIVASNLGAVAQQDEFLSLIKGDLMYLLQSLVAVEPAPLPDLLCIAAIAWLRHMKEERKVDCDEVMRQVPLKGVSADALKRASQAAFLSEQVMWAIQPMLWTAQRVQELRAEVENMKSHSKSLASNLETAKEALAKAKPLAVNRRLHLEKIVNQASTTDGWLVKYHNREVIPGSATYAVITSWINDEKTKRNQERSEAISFVSMQAGVDY